MQRQKQDSARMIAQAAGVTEWTTSKQARKLAVLLFSMPLEDIRRDPYAKTIIRRALAKMEQI